MTRKDKLRSQLTFENLLGVSGPARKSNPNVKSELASSIVSLLTEKNANGCEQYFIAAPSGERLEGPFWFTSHATRYAVEKGWSLGKHD